MESSLGAGRLTLANAGAPCERQRATLLSLDGRATRARRRVWTASAILLSMTTEDLPGGSAPGTSHPAGVVPQPPVVRDGELADLQRPEFPMALRGYDREAVDSYVDRVNRTLAELEAGRSPQSAIRHALDQVGEETSGILERAHETADGIAARSRAQAEERVQRAKREARALVEAAETRARV